IKEDTPEEFDLESEPLWKNHDYFLISVMECSNMIKEYRKDKLLVLYHDNKDLFNHYLYVIKILINKLKD
ncbi:12951_t:CDS:1, partial [Cetraspora pellucida]